MATRRCTAKSKSGKRCKAAAIQGSDYCFAHEPTLAAKRAEWRRKGGQQSGRRAVLDEAAQTLDLSWSSDDADDDLLIFVVQYSADDGATWHTVLFQYPWLDARISTRLLPGSTSARLRVLATDGANTTIATSDPFTLAKHAPEPQIGGVNEGERLAFGQRVDLQGLALDAEEGSLPDSSLSWTVSGPSPVTGSGSLLPLPDLSPGPYTATLSATDGDEQVGTATRQFEVSALTVPDAAAPVLDGTCSDAGYADSGGGGTHDVVE